LRASAFSLANVEHPFPARALPAFSCASATGKQLMLWCGETTAFQRQAERGATGFPVRLLDKVCAPMPGSEVGIIWQDISVVTSCVRV
jgi:hypothetical protein